jgi:hypothetical protein
MALKMHHTNATFLRLRGITVAERDGVFVTTNTAIEFRGDGKAICAAIKAHEAETGKKLRGAGRADKSGVMVKSYHEQYTANGGGNADLLDTTMRDELIVDVDGEPALDRVRLKKEAVRLGVWNERYETLNPGMARMNVANRLRALIRKEGEVAVFGVRIGEADLKPRPAAKPKAEKKAKRAKKQEAEQIAA